MTCEEYKSKFPKIKNITACLLRNNKLFLEVTSQQMLLRFKYKRETQLYFKGYQKSICFFSFHSIKFIQALLDAVIYLISPHIQQPVLCDDLPLTQKLLTAFWKHVQHNTNNSIGNPNTPGVASEMKAEPPRKCSNNYCSLPVSFYH